MKLIAKIPPLLRNKYLITGSLFLVWIYFFDLKDLKTHFEKRKEYQALQASEKALQQTIAATKDELKQLKTNAQTIEKYAREKYL
ncbi:MAG: FtsB family cell division protein, partial [Ferruginibacter sp.]